MKTSLLTLALAVITLVSPLVATGQSQVTMAWDPVTDPRVIGYVLYWGTNSGNYTSSAGSQATSLTVTNLIPGKVYYFAVKSATANATSTFSTEVAYTNPLTASTPPPVPGSNSQTAGNSSPSPNSPPPASLPAQEIRIAGIPPVLSLATTNGLQMNILGTEGAALMVQATTNLTDPDSWVTITNLTLTNVVNLGSQSNPPAGLLADAFSPAMQPANLMETNMTAFQYYHAVMPHGYPILAYTVLPAKGYVARLLMVDMPGFDDDVCFASPNNSIIYYDPQTTGVGVESSGSTIRQIATTYAGMLNQNWTSASELSYSNGVGWVLATVVETENPSQDPVAGQAGTNAPIAIDF